MPTDSVILDDFNTWPQDLQNLLRRYQRALVERAEVVDPASSRTERAHVTEEVLLELDRVWAHVRAEAERSLSGGCLLAYHCTRLTVDEIEGVRRDGLALLEVAAMRRKIDARVAAGDLNAECAGRLQARLDRNVLEPTRGKTLWATMSELALMEELKLHQPLIYWGGEAILSYVDGDHPHLASIGSACIVEFSAPFSAAVQFDPTEAFLERFVYMQRGYGENGANDICFASAVPAERIRRIIGRREPDFERLTACDTWSRTIT